MKFNDVRVQLDEVVKRAIETGVAVAQTHPIHSQDENFQTLGDLKSTSIALKNIPYKNIYDEISENKQYHIKLPDGGLLIFQYTFAKNDNAGLIKHRLAYFPCPILPTIEEAPELYRNDELYGDIILNRIVRFPVRFDYDPKNYKPRVHPHSHLTFGQFDNCRIPVVRPVAPNEFMIFILRNFYFLLYRKHQNKLERRIANCPTTVCITNMEKGIPHLML
jgi:hypothetical protein